MLAKLFIAAIVIVFAMVVSLTGAISMDDHGGVAHVVGLVVVIAAWLIAAGVVARAVRGRMTSRRLGHPTNDAGAAR
jgi:Kef-type K+ transport system membrane component KefB